MKASENKNIIRLIRMISLLVLVLFLINTIACLVYTSMESNHHCEHEDCPICETILLCENSMRNMLGGAAVIFTVNFLLIIIDLIKNIYHQFFIRMTPVNQGIRMNE